MSDQRQFDKLPDRVSHRQAELDNWQRQAEDVGRRKTKLTHYTSPIQQGYGSGRPMPRRKYPPVELDAEGNAWCSQCDRLVSSARRERRADRYCRCDDPAAKVDADSPS